MAADVSQAPWLRADSLPLLLSTLLSGDQDICLIPLQIRNGLLNLAKVIFVNCLPIRMKEEASSSLHSDTDFVTFVPEFGREAGRPGWCW